MNVIIPMNNHPQMVYCVANILSISIFHHPSSSIIIIIIVIIIITIIITIITTIIIISSSSSNIFCRYTILQRNMHNVLYIYIIPHYIMITSTISTWLYFSILCLDMYIWSRPPSLHPPLPPPWVGSPGSSPNSLLFASYWQHFWGPASYLLGLCSISDYQPRIY